MAKASKVQLSDCSLPFRDAVAPVLSARINDFWQLSHCIQNEHDTRGLHDLRIAGKRIRYCLEFFKEIMAEDMSGAISSFKQLQDYLGEIHDCDVWLAMFDENTEMGVRPSTAIAEIEERISAKRIETYRKLASFWNELEQKGFRQELEQSAGIR